MVGEKEVAMALMSVHVARREPVLGGRPFGAAGGYEKIDGTLRFGVDPMHPLHAQITDFDRAPRNGAGLVECAADFYLLRPRDGARGNGALLLDVPNRGRKLALAMFNSTPRAADPTMEEDFGNGFLMRHGYTVAWVGWQPDVPRVDGLVALDAPAARGVTGLVRCEFRPNLPARQLPLADRYHIPQPTMTLDDPEARLTVSEHSGAEPVMVPRASWCFSDPTHLELDGGFVPGRIYTLIYRAQDPTIVGLGLVAVRDTAAWLRFGSAADGNPCAGTLARAYAVSQSGRFLRHFLYLGLNEDERGRRVFDAMIPHVAGARRGEFNMRFGQPSLNAREAVSAVDADGNEVAGIRPVELRVPLATFTGWNPRHPDQGAPGDIMSMMGSTLPFCRTADERVRRGDPRPSVAERYASRDAYLARVRAACAELCALRHMLAEDMEAVVARAGRQYDLFQTLA